MKKLNVYIFNRIVTILILGVFLSSTILPPVQAKTNLIPESALEDLPIPGAMVTMTEKFTPVLIHGLTIHPNNPFEFDFFVGIGDADLKEDALRDEADKLIKYFLAALTVPEEEMWVNLSPYEKDRIIPEGLGDTQMGRDLLMQDYMLKQLTASLMYPETELGEEFWNRVYERAYEEYGSTVIPTNTFHKVWIVPGDVLVLEKDNSAYVLDSHLRVMLEEDYLSRDQCLDCTNQVSTDVIRNIIIPAIEKEVNEGKTFSNLRQIYHSMILATWYKLNLEQTFLGQAYVDQNKTSGVDTYDKHINQKIYARYVASFKKGVYDYIKEDYDPSSQTILPRKYFSGGFSDKGILSKLVKSKTARVLMSLAEISTLLFSIEGRVAKAKENVEIIKYLRKFNNIESVYSINVNTLLDGFRFPPWMNPSAYLEEQMDRIRKIGYLKGAAEDRNNRTALTGSNNRYLHIPERIRKRLKPFKRFIDARKKKKESLYDSYRIKTNSAEEEEDGQAYLKGLKKTDHQALIGIYKLIVENDIESAEKILAYYQDQNKVPGVSMSEAFMVGILAAHYTYRTGQRKFAPLIRRIQEAAFKLQDSRFSNGQHMPVSSDNPREDMTMDSLLASAFYNMVLNLSDVIYKKGGNDKQGRMRLALYMKRQSINEYLKTQMTRGYLNRSQDNTVVNTLTQALAGLILPGENFVKKALLEARSKNFKSLKKGMEYENFEGKKVKNMQYYTVDNISSEADFIASIYMSLALDINFKIKAIRESFVQKVLTPLAKLSHNKRHQSLPESNVMNQEVKRPYTHSLTNHPSTVGAVLYMFAVLRINPFQLEQNLNIVDPDPAGSYQNIQDRRNESVEKNLQEYNQIVKFLERNEGAEHTKAETVTVEVMKTVLAHQNLNFTLSSLQELAQQYYHNGSHEIGGFSLAVDQRISDGIESAILPKEKDEDIKNELIQTLLNSDISYGWRAAALNVFIKNHGEEAARNLAQANPKGLLPVMIEGMLKDTAMTTSTGGINLDSAMMNMAVQHDGGMVSVPFPIQPESFSENFTGIIPIIQNIHLIIGPPISD